MKTMVKQRQGPTIPDFVLWAGLCLLPPGKLSAADAKTLSLHAVPAPGGLKVQVQAVDRSTINTDQYVDLAGNSGEWCADYFDNTSYEEVPSNGVAIIRRDRRNLSSRRHGIDIA